LISALKNEQGFEKINGISFKRDGNYFDTPKREVLRDLDSLPMPAWDLVDIDLYRKKMEREERIFLDEHCDHTRMSIQM
jgi:anaerobic magnesium-protoporphyrin IX monomethyl ester cyclase